MDRKNFSSDHNDSRRKLWRFSLQVLKARKCPRGPTHTLLYYAVRQQLIKRIITTNIDGLEILDETMLSPDIDRDALSLMHAVPPNRQDKTIRFLHGDICTITCNSCYERHVLTEDIAGRLIDGTYPPCQLCVNNERPREPVFWRPDILFYGDPNEEFNSEDTDPSWQTGPRKQHKAAPTGTNEESPLAADKHDEAVNASNLFTGEDAIIPTHVFVIGSSLGDRRLSRDLSQVSRHGTQVIFVNPVKPANMQNVIWVDSTAKEFSQCMLNALLQRPRLQIGA